MKYSRLCDVALHEVERTLSELPPEIATKAREVAIVLEPFPTDEQFESGVEDDSLGLFDGFPVNAPDAPVLSPQIFLFVENLWDEADANLRNFRDEIRITLLHELGHYLGWDEDEVAARGLE